MSVTGEEFHFNIKTKYILLVSWQQTLISFFIMVIMNVKVIQSRKYLWLRLHNNLLKMKPNFVPISDENNSMYLWLRSTCIPVLANIASLTLKFINSNSKMKIQV